MLFFEALFEVTSSHEIYFVKYHVLVFNFSIEFHTMSEFNLFKDPSRSDCFRIFSNFLRFWYRKKTQIVLITPRKFYS